MDKSWEEANENAKEAKFNEIGPLFKPVDDKFFPQIPQVLPTKIVSFYKLFDFKLGQ